MFPLTNTDCLWQDCDPEDPSTGGLGHDGGFLRVIKVTPALPRGCRICDVIRALIENLRQQKRKRYSNTQKKYSNYFRKIILRLRLSITECPSIPQTTLTRMSKDNDI
jgi:hypothetical protein